jgi:peptidoglycan LD-endopeptidase LytH
MICPFDFKNEHYHIFDFTVANPDFKTLDFGNIEAFNAYVFETLKAKNVKVGIGGWLENRVVYDVSHFQGAEQRCYHLGVDIWAEAGTPIFAPEDCEIHSFKNNANLGDYGPTIILKSSSQNLFYLFGHLSLNSLGGLEKGQMIKKGEHFAEIGPYPENGNWPPHLHFQVMNTMNGKEGDFPGVCSFSELEYYKGVCLNPYPYAGITLLDLGFII